MTEQSQIKNRILARLPPDDFALLRDALEPASLGRADILAEAGQPIEHMVFPQRGIASVIAQSPDGNSVEAGIIGREGFVHPGLVFGTDRLPFKINVQLPDHAFRIRREVVLDAAERSETLRNALLTFGHAYAVQVGYTLLSNAVHSVEERLSRWLLMCHDRSDTDDLALTHEFIGLMLAVRRPSVTTALHTLEGNGFIENVRGYVTIRNRSALEEFAADAYGTPEAEYRRLMGPL